MNIVMTANSPGEVASWLRPMVGAFRSVAPEATIRVCLAPCTFATGAEEAVVRSIPGVASVYAPKETVAWALWGKTPPDVDTRERGIVLFLGGDLFYAALLGRRTGWPAAAYTEGRTAWQKRFRRFFVPGEAARLRALQSGAPSDQVTVSGDLMLDGLTPRRSAPESRPFLGLDGSSPVVGLFPGSRRHEVANAIPAFLQAAAHMASERPDVRFAAALSPFVTPDVLVEAMRDGGLFSPSVDRLIEVLFGDDASSTGYPWSAAHRSAWVDWVPSAEDEGHRMRVPALRLLLVRGAPYDVAVASDVVLTIPGSNTAELAGLGVPMVVAVALDRLQQIPLEGLPGLVGGIPVVGPAIRRRAIERLNRKTAFMAWPNRRAGRMVVPELRLRTWAAKDVAKAVLDLLDDEPGRIRMADELKELMGEPGAARRIAEACLSMV